ncbi:MAG: hypothetical protein IPJ88_03725 [Myxococcales bacterium]|nr:MAG: hypothetical protein IPJ88_03725 [Myxococcales bacterium]
MTESGLVQMRAPKYERKNLFKSNGFWMYFSFLWAVPFMFFYRRLRLLWFIGTIPFAILYIPPLCTLTLKLLGNHVFALYRLSNLGGIAYYLNLPFLLWHAFRRFFPREILGILIAVVLIFSAITLRGGLYASGLYRWNDYLNRRGRVGAAIFENQKEHRAFLQQNLAIGAHVLTDPRLLVEVPRLFEARVIIGRFHSPGIRNRKQREKDYGCATSEKCDIHRRYSILKKYKITHYVGLARTKKDIPNEWRKMFKPKSLILRNGWFLAKFTDKAGDDAIAFFAKKQQRKMEQTKAKAKKAVIPDSSSD